MIEKNIVLCYNIEKSLWRFGMKFELNEYHHNTSDEEFIEDVRKTAERLNKDTLTGAEYDKHGTYHSSTLTRRFGSWKIVLEKSGLKTKGHNFKFSYSDDYVVKDLKRVASILGKETLTGKEYELHGEFSRDTLMKHYGSWNAVLKLAGMELNLNRNFTDEEMFEEIERVWVLLGRQPTTTDIKKGLSTFSLQSYARRFGGWRGALQAFVNYINADEIEEQDNTDNLPTAVSTLTAENTVVAEKTEASRKTSRDINLRLRFMVMKRDNFKCCACGASPAKNPSVELHIDHIIPWSKGGETVIENLQTLCAECNLGKSNII